MEGLTTQQINEFYRKANDVHDSLSLLTLAKETCIKKESTEEIYFDNMGKFLQFSVWSTMGYDAEAIEANSASKDIRFDRVLGKVYRVMTMVTGDKGPRWNDYVRDYELQRVWQK